MKRVLIINPILYTPENGKRKQSSIKDCLLVTVCLSFINCRYQPTLIADKYYQPIDEERFPFDIVYLDHRFESIFSLYKIPFPVGLASYLKDNKEKYDFIISSEIFSIYSFIAAGVAKEKLIIWHELALHNKILHGFASRFWYGVVAKFRFHNVLVAPRSLRAKNFIIQYCNRVDEKIYPHPINVDIFEFCRRKKQYLISVSQLVERKRVDKIIEMFSSFSKDNDYVLYICGDGEQRCELEKLVSNNKLTSRVIFTGQLCHSELAKLLNNASGLLIYTSQDNSILTISESIASGTPVLSTSVPDNSDYIILKGCGIVKDEWTEEDIADLVANNDEYINNCQTVRSELTGEFLVKEFIALSKKLKEDN